MTLAVYNLIGPDQCFSYIPVAFEAAWVLATLASAQSADGPSMVRGFVCRRRAYSSVLAIRLHVFVESAKIRLVLISVCSIEAFLLFVFNDP